MLDKHAANANETFIKEKDYLQKLTLMTLKASSEIVSQAIQQNLSKEELLAYFNSRLEKEFSLETQNKVKFFTTSAQMIKKVVRQAVEASKINFSIDLARLCKDQSREELQYQFECQICTNVLCSPKSCLKCSCNICINCVTKIYKSQNPSCPNCREENFSKMLRDSPKEFV